MLSTKGIGPVLSTAQPTALAAAMLLLPLGAGACSRSQENRHTAQQLPPSAGEVAPPRTLQAGVAAALVREEVDPLSVGMPVPTTWPPDGSGTVWYFAYASRAAPTGRVTYEIAAPTRRVTVNVVAPDTGIVQIVALQGGDLGRQGRDFLDAEVSAAGVEALFEMLAAGQMTVERQRTLVSTYSEWRQKRSVIAEAILAHVPAFSAWLRREAEVTPRSHAP